MAEPPSETTVSIWGVFLLQYNLLSIPEELVFIHYFCMSLDIWSFATSMPQKTPLFWRHESQKKLSSMLYPWKQLFLHLPMMTEQLTHIEEMVHINVDLRNWYEKFAQELHSSRNHYFSHKKKKNEVSVLLQKRI